MPTLLWTLFVLFLALAFNPWLDRWSDEASAALVLEGLANLAWFFDWGGTATGSSTAGALYVVLPILALGIGAVVARLAVTFSGGASS